MDAPKPHAPQVSFISLCVLGFFGIGGNRLKDFLELTQDYCRQTYEARLEGDLHLFRPLCEAGTAAVLSALFATLILSFGATFLRFTRALQGVRAVRRRSRHVDVKDLLLAAEQLFRHRAARRTTAAPSRQSPAMVAQIGQSRPEHDPAKRDADAPEP